MANKLQRYFPMIQTREEVIGRIADNAILQQLYNSWEEEQQKEFLDFCTGARGVKILYDSFFKEVINPELYPDRLEDLLSTFLGRSVKIIQILPNESSSITDDKSLLIMDIVVELENGSIANVEIQKIGYAFPGERCACYSADLLLRQYKRVRNERKKKFSYKDIKTVYTIVFFEKSTMEFKQLQKQYIHWGKVNFDTGLALNIPQEYLLIPLDIFQKNMQNKAIRDRKEAWLGFLSYDQPDRIEEIINKYPEFRKMYEEIYEICQNIERVMEMFSKELREMDQNTVKYMIEEQQEQIEEQQGKIENLQENNRLKDMELEKKEKELQALRTLLEEMKSAK